MTPGARVAAAITVLDNINSGRRAEQALSAWARSSRFAGSKDRAALRDLVFDVLRMRATCAAFGGGADGRALMLGLGRQQAWDMAAIFSGEGHAAAALTAEEAAQLTVEPKMSPAVAADLPEWLWPIWQADLDRDGLSAALASRQRAGLFLRVNQRRGDAASAIGSLASDDIAAIPHPTQSNCLRVISNERRVKTASAYLSGRVEIQDAASQIAVAAMDLSLGARVLDFCAGGGGKALAISDMFAADVTAHDAASGRTADIAPRAARADAKVPVLETSQLAAAAPFDVVVVDAPCSGSGTWRRNPEAKWALTPEKLNEFSNLQGDVLRQAAPLVGYGGQLVYMTCSVLRAENDAVVAGFCADHPAWEPQTPLRLVPCDDHDGFYCCLLSLKV